MANLNEQIKVVQIGNFPSVAANGLSNLDLEKTGTYHYIGLECLASNGTAVSVANIKAEIDSISVVMNGKKIVDGLTPTDLYMLEQFYRYKEGVSNANGVLMIPCVPPDIVNPEQKKVAALGTLVNATGQRPFNFYVEVKMANTVSNIAQIKLFALRQDVDTQTAPIYCLDKITKTHGSTGEDVIREIPFNTVGQLLKAFHIHETYTNATSAVSQITIQKGTELIANVLTDRVNDQMLKWRGLTPQAGFFSYSFNQYNGLNDGLDLNISDLQVKPTFAAKEPNTYKILLERIKTQLD